MKRNFIVLVTTCPSSEVGQQELVCCLQTAYNNGVAGQFQVVPHAGGFVIVFDRYTDGEDHEYILKRRMTSAASTVQAALEQLRDEIQACMPEGVSKGQILKGQWTAIDFAGALDIQEEIAVNMLPVRVEPGQFWYTKEGDLVQVVGLELTAETAQYMVYYPSGDKRLCDANGQPVGLMTEASRKAKTLTRPLGLHLAVADLPGHWLEPIRSDADAESFLSKLSAQGHLFHPEDEPATVVSGTGQPLFNAVEIGLLRLRMAEVHYYHPDPCAFALQLTSEAATHAVYSGST